MKFIYIYFFLCLFIPLKKGHALDLVGYKYDKVTIYQVNWTAIGKRRWNEVDARSNSDYIINILANDQIKAYVETFGFEEMINPRDDSNFKLRIGGGYMTYDRIWEIYKEPADFKDDIDIRYVADFYTNEEDEKPVETYVSDGYYLYSPERTKVRAVDYDFLTLFGFGDLLFRKEEFVK